MGDRCVVSLTCREQDVAKFEALGFERDEWSYDKDGLGVYMIGEEMNYAATTELETLAQEGVPFYGSHGAGGEYTENIFAAANGESVWVEHLNYLPAVAVNRDGTIDPSYLEYAHIYFRLEAAAKALIEEAHGARERYLAQLSETTEGEA
jgi:hypothetical protein